MGRWITKNGAHVWIEDGSLYDALDRKYNHSNEKFIDKVSKTFENIKHSEYIEVDKSVYKRLSNIINTYPKKYKIGRHVIDLDNIVYFVNIENYNFFGVYMEYPANMLDKVIEFYDSF